MHAANGRMGISLYQVLPLRLSLMAYSAFLRQKSANSVSITTKQQCEWHVMDFAYLADLAISTRYAVSSLSPRQRPDRLDVRLRHVIYMC